jgi:MFS family permease
VIAFAYLVGPAFGTTLGGTLMNYVGWRPVFILFGALSLLWLWPWSRVRVAEPLPRAAAGEGAADEGPTYGEILRQRGLWGASLGHFAANYNFYFCLSWLPYYLVKSRDFDGRPAGICVLDQRNRGSRRRLVLRCLDSRRPVGQRDL